MNQFAHLFIALGLAGSCSASTLTFGCIPDVAGTCIPDLSGQLFADVTDAGDESVDFTFRNEGPTPSFISDIYFDTLSGYFSSLMILTEGPGVDFTAPTAGGNLPRGNSLTPQFDEDWQVHNAPGAANGINPGEFLTLRAEGQTFAVVLSDIQTEALRIGIHVQGIGTADASDSYLNNPPDGTPIPEPGTYAMLLMGVGAIAIARLRRRSV